MTTRRHDAIRKFNHRILNPVTKLFAGHVLYSLIYHTGRRSGREYSTPVVAAIGSGHIYVPLPYGTDTDWHLNVRAAGICKVMIRGKLYAATEPTVVDPEEALWSFPSILRWSFKRARIGQYLQLSTE